MNEFFEYLSKNPQMVPIFAAVIALIGVVLSAFVGFTISKRSAYITSVTTERSKWIEKLRGNIADLLAVCGEIHRDPTKKTSGVASTKHSEADRLIALITLQLNPFDNSGIDQKLINLLPKLVKSSESTPDKYREFERQFVRHAQFLLKEEWEKVKSEAKGATLAWLTGAACERRKRADEYR